VQNKLKVLVTGGAGLIGSNLAKKLIELNYEVFVIDNLWRGKKENLFHNNKEIIDLKTNFYQHDLKDYNNCLEASKDMDIVIHLADIVAGINYVFDNELFVYRSNVLMNSNMIHAAIKNKVNKFIYVGTACSYPAEMQSELNPPPFKEEDVYPANPESSYGWSKLMGEYECELAQKTNSIEVGILRLHNVYGPPCEISPEKSQVIPALCRKAINFPNEEFIIWGSGEQKRAFLYVDDVIKGIIQTLDRGMNKGVIQIGPSESTSITSIAEKIVNLSNKEINIQYDLTKPEGDKDRIADWSKAKSVIDWEPKISIEEGLKKTFDWVHSYIELSKK